MSSVSFRGDQIRSVNLKSKKNITWRKVILDNRVAESHNQFGHFLGQDEVKESVRSFALRPNHRVSAVVRAKTRLIGSIRSIGLGSDQVTYIRGQTRSKNMARFQLCSSIVL